MKASLVTCGLLAAFAAGVRGETHPVLQTKACTAAGCVTENSGIVLDYRWMATASQYPANGISISGNSLKLTLTPTSGPRVYLTASDNNYKMIKMVGKELSYDVDTSQLDCNMNGALYFIQMPENQASNGSGYCDANCVGGTCCAEMDIWEANRYATVFTTHTSGSDANGCGYNPYANGRKTFYGPGSSYTVDTTKTFKVITQFLTGSNGQVNEIKRIYQQNGQSFDGGSLTASCNVATMGQVMSGGSVLAFSIWSSYSMGWLDAGNNGPCPTGSTSSSATVTFSDIRVGDIGTTASTTTVAPTTTPTPTTTATPTTTPTATTTKPVTTATPTTTPTPTVTTTKPVTTATPTTTPTPTTTKPSTGVAQKWGQCGGIGWTGPTTCVAGTTCKYSNDWYSQCL